MEINDKKKEALNRAFVGVKDKREEAFLLLTATPEEYLPDLVEYLQILNGLKEIRSRH